VLYVYIIFVPQYLRIELLTEYEFNIRCILRFHFMILFNFMSFLSHRTVRRLARNHSEPQTEERITVLLLGIDIQVFIPEPIALHQTLFCAGQPHVWLPLLAAYMLHDFILCYSDVCISSFRVETTGTSVQYHEIKG
jgi:hypothetical protein